MKKAWTMGCHPTTSDGKCCLDAKKYIDLTWEETRKKNKQCQGRKPLLLREEVEMGIVVTQYIMRVLSENERRQM